MTDRPKTTERALFEALVREHGGRLRLYLRAATRDEAATDDLLQETLLVAWRRIGDFDPERCFGAWTRGIAARLVLARSRTRRGVALSPEVLEQLEELCATEPGLAASRLTHELDALDRCVERLTPEQRELIQLRYTEGRAVAALAEHAGRSVEGTKKVLQRVRARLHECITATLAAEGASS